MRLERSTPSSPPSPFNPTGWALTVDSAVNVKVLDVAPDYVFEKDYNLMPLSEIENYVALNKHLPEVPSGKEIAKNGINAGDMSLVLLRKIEELTLHMIELEKSNNSMAEKINKLKNDK